MIVQDIMKNITERLGATSHVDAVFGDSREIGKKTVIPIAEVNLGFGAGGGEGKQEAREEYPAQEGSGGGGGGGARVRPLAFLEVTTEQTSLVPVIDYTRIILAAIACSALSTYVIAKTVQKIKSQDK